MKARTKTTRWLLIALLFGFLAVTGLTLTHHHGAPTFATIIKAVAPHPGASNTAPAASIGGETHTFTAPVGTGLDHEVVASTDSNIQPPHSTGGNSNAPAAAATTPDSNYPTDGGARQGNGAATTSTPASPPQNGVGDYAYNSYTPLDCELPAGCGAPGATGYVSRPPSGTSGEVPVHDSSSPGSDGSGTQTNNNGNPPSGNGNTGNSGTPGPSYDPPKGNSPVVASAPELDPATLAAAVTLLLGSLAVLRRRRVRATR